MHTKHTYPVKGQAELYKAMKTMCIQNKERNSPLIKTFKKN